MSVLTSLLNAYLDNRAPEPYTLLCVCDDEEVDDWGTHLTAEDAVKEVENDFHKCCKDGCAEFLLDVVFFVVGPERCERVITYREGSPFPVMMVRNLTDGTVQEYDNPI